MNNAIILTFISGLSTLVGGFISIFLKNKKVNTSVILGFASGIMIFISLGELFGESAEVIGYMNAVISFFIGVVVILLIDFFIPHEYGEEDCCIKDSALKKCLKNNRCLILLTLGVAIHNVPEGIAVFYSSLSGEKIGLAVALAIILHNIPEGIIINMATKNNKENKYGLLLTTVAGLAEPLGAILTYVFLYRFINEITLGYMLGAVAGIMCFISFDELLPKAYTTKSSHQTIIGIFLGIAVMALSIIFLEVSSL